MNRMTRRWCFLALAGTPIVLGITAQPLSVRLEEDRLLRVSAPDLDFLTDQPLKRLKDGRTVGYLAQLTVSSGKERILHGRSIGRFAFSYDIWTERFTVTLVVPGDHPPTSRNLTRGAAQAWCLDQ